MPKVSNLTVSDNKVLNGQITKQAGIKINCEGLLGLFIMAMVFPKNVLAACTTAN